MSQTDQIHISVFPRYKDIFIHFLKKFWETIILLLESKIGTIGAAIVMFWFLLALFAPLISPYDPNISMEPNLLPGGLYSNGSTSWLGTDHLGRDMLSRIIWGGRTALFWATLATITAYFFGTVLGLMAGYKRGIIDNIIVSVANVILAFPVLVIYLIIISLIGASGLNIIVAIVFATSPGIMRIVRGLTLETSKREYIEAARTQGQSDFEIMFKEILPNVCGPLIIDGCLRIGYVIVMIGILGFLGLGLPPPDPDWGGMINETRQLAMIFPHMTVLPAMAISSLVLGLSFLADGLHDIANSD